MGDFKQPIPYKEPSWGGVPEKPYSLEILKNGTIVDTINLTEKSFHVVGRLKNCDLYMEHPSISRFHAVFQYKSEGSDDKPQGVYLYDLGSTHGTFHNKNRCIPKTYYRLRVGHGVKFGGSTRLVILQGPEEDSEEESDLSLTEMKEKAREREERKRREVEKKEEKEKSSACSWGMTDDAEEEPDLENNPFATSTENETLYLDDPKKTLRGWFEREGYELEYDCNEVGYAQFQCKVELPVDQDGAMSTMVAEATVKGKKKEAVIQCALEACRILDRLGLLRQSNHESKAKKQTKKWEDEDFYESDEDEFLDRTGSIEQKRKKRMKMAGKGVAEIAETYDSLLEKKAKIENEMSDLKLELQTAQSSSKVPASEDDLDAYMSQLNSGSIADKGTVTKLKQKLTTLNQESAYLDKLITIAKPTSLPDLKPPNKPKFFSSGGIMIGKRRGGIGGMRALTKPKEVPKPSQPASKTMEVVLPQVESTKQEEEKPNAVKEAFKKPEVMNIIKSKEHVSAKQGDLLTGQEIMEEKSIEDVQNEIDLSVPDNSGAVKGPQISDRLRQTLKNEAERNEQEVKSPEVSTENEEEHIPKSKKHRKRRRPNKDDEGKVSGGYDASDPKYAVWMPPEDQLGDGRTSLNDKLGY